MNRRRALIRDGGAVGLLCLLVIVFTWRIALAGRVLAGGDIFTYFYPYWAEATRAIRAGRLPLWNPTLFMGAPFAANSQVGVFYPLNWPLWLLLPAHRSVHVSVVLHLGLAAVNAYVWGRRGLRLGRPAAWTVGVIFALGGYLGAQVEHVNQLQGLAWLPLMLTLTHQITHPGDHSGDSNGGPAGKAALRVLQRRWVAACTALALVIAMVLLAGHTQTAFISLFGTAAYGLVPALVRSLGSGSWRPTARGAALLAVAVLLSVALAGVQLLPTWGLSRLSVRAQGLPFNERVSFSLSPLYAGRALLPAFGGAVPPDHLEHVVWIGVAGLALAIEGVARYMRRAGRSLTQVSACQPECVLVLLGLFFAFGLYNPIYLLLARYVPGFAHFRVPARWLALYGIGVAGLAGRGIESLRTRKPPGGGRLLIIAGLLAALILWSVAGARLDQEADLAQATVIGWGVAVVGVTALFLAARRRSGGAAAGLVVLLVVELLVAGRTLPRARATAPQAFTSLRPAIAHLLASDYPDGGGPRGRFLSMSDITFDPGDLSLIRMIYGPQLSDDQLYDLIVATKQKEVLSPNLPLAFGVPALDGYGGGLLPLQRYVMLQQAFLSAEEVSIDGRLRENLTAIPDGRWLSLFNVRYVITDKLRDAWIDDVFYDLQFQARLGQGERADVGEVPDFEATALGVVSHLEQGGGVLGGAAVGVVRVELDDGEVHEFALRAGEDIPLSGTGRSGAPETAARVRWSEPGTPVSITVEATASTGAWVVRGMSLIDERTGSFQSLVVSDQGRFRLAHSGDVKIYENLDILPRAFVVSAARRVSDDGAALEALGDPALDVSSEIVLGGSQGTCKVSEVGDLEGLGRAPRGMTSARITSYGAEQVEIEATLDHPGYLVLTDAYYPGWQATVDGEPAPVCQANLLFRAVPLEPGEHRVVFSFRPNLQRVGIGITAAGLVAVLGAALAGHYVSRWSSE